MLVLAGGADVILIPEIPYDVNNVAKSILRRSRSGRSFSIVAVAEGALSKEEYKTFKAAQKKVENAKNKNEKKEKTKKT